MLCVIMCYSKAYFPSSPLQKTAPKCRGFMYILVYFSFHAITEQSLNFLSFFYLAAYFAGLHTIPLLNSYSQKAFSKYAFLQ